MEADTAPELPHDGGSVRGGRVWLSSLAAKAGAIARLPRAMRRRGNDDTTPVGGNGRDTLAPAGEGVRDPAAESAGGSGGARQAVRAMWRRVPRTPFAAAVAIVALSIVFVGAVSYYSAREFSGRAADTRASNEAMSFAGHSARLANGDAFSGYIQILRYAEDPVVTAKYAEPAARQNALQQLLYLNTNKFASLTIADRTGIIFATTDSRITSLKESATFAETRANLSPANSDILLPQAGEHGYVEYTAPLRDTDGSIWGILVGRADPATLWRETLLAAVDGGRNVIINSEGQFAAGVPDELLRLPWHGQPLPNGAVRASIAGIDSICGLAPIGKDTQIDRGLNVASCLPASIIQAEQSDATGKQSLITLAAAVLAIVAAAGALRIVWARATLGGAGSTPRMEIADRIAALAPEPAPAPAPAEEAPVITETEAAPADEADAPASVTVVQLPPPDVDAVTLIDAYEARNARLAERLREQLQARLLVAATQADEAYKLAGADEGLSASLHEKAMQELEGLREREIRAIGQELYPGLVRLGLPGAMRAMKKELADVIEVRLDVDATMDSVATGRGRAALGPGLRLVLYRFVLDGVRMLAFAGASSASVTFAREGDWLALRVSGRPADGEIIDPDAMAADAIAVEAYAGVMEITEDAAGVTMAARVPSPRPADAPDDTLATGDEDSGAAAFDADVPDESEQPKDEPVPVARAGDAAEADDDGGASHDSSLIEAFAAQTHTREDADGPPVRSFTLDGNDAAIAADDDLIAAFGGPSRGIGGELELVQAEMFGSVIVALDIADNVLAADARDEVSVHARSLVRDVVKASLLALKAVEAERATVSALIDGRMLVVSVASEGGETPALLGEVEALHGAVRDADGMLLIAADGAAAEVTVRVPADASGDAAAA